MLLLSFLLPPKELDNSIKYRHSLPLMTVFCISNGLDWGGSLEPLYTQIISFGSLINYSPKSYVYLPSVN